MRLSGIRWTGRVGVIHPVERSGFEVRKERVVPQSQEPIRGKHEHPSFTTEGDLSKEERILVLGRSAAIQGLVRGNRKREMGQGDDVPRPLQIQRIAASHFARERWLVEGDDGRAMRVLVRHDGQRKR